MWFNILMFALVSLATYCLRKILSSEPNYVQFQFKFFLFYFFTSLAALVLFPIYSLNPKNVKNAKFGSSYMKHVTKLYNLKWELRNGHILSEDRGAIVVSNHQSSLDVLGLFNIWEVVDKMTVIAKKELFYILPFGPSAYLAGVVFINRSKAKEAYKTLKVTSEIMVKKKTKIWVFPEGTRNKDYSKMLPFKKGAFTMAVDAQVPIIPVVFSPYYFINKKKYIFNKGHVVINCLEPISTKGMTPDDIPELMKRVYDIMQAEYTRLSKEVLENLPKDYPHTLMG